MGAEINMSSFKSIVMSGYYGFDNSGDDAILKAITTDLKNKDENIRITVLSNNPSKTKNVYGVEAVDRFKFAEVLEAIRESSLVISGGGSLLQDITSTRSLIYYLAIMSLAKLYKKPVMVYANGIGPIDGSLNRGLTKMILNRVDLISLRDQDSKDYIEKMGVKNDQVHITADPVFTLDAASKDRVDEIFEKEDIARGDRQYLGISVRKWKDNERLIEEMAKTIKKIRAKKDVEIILIPMHYPEDLEISQAIIEKVASENCHVLEEEYSVEEIMGVINELELIVAMRLHSLIYAATQEVPMIGLSYDPKVDGILSSLNVNHICNVDDFTSSELYHLIEDAWSQRDSLRENLKVQDEDLKSKALLNVEMAFKLLEEDK